MLPSHVALHGSIPMRIPRFGFMNHDPSWSSLSAQLRYPYYTTVSKSGQYLFIFHIIAQFQTAPPPNYMPFSPGTPQ